MMAVAQMIPRHAVLPRMPLGGRLVRGHGPVGRAVFTQRVLRGQIGPGGPGILAGNPARPGHPIQGAVFNLTPDARLRDRSGRIRLPWPAHGLPTMRHLVLLLLELSREAHIRCMAGPQLTAGAGTRPVRPEVDLVAVLARVDIRPEITPLAPICPVGTGTNPLPAAHRTNAQEEEQHRTGDNRQDP